MNLYKYASPAMFYPLAGKLIPWFAIPAALLFATGLFVGFFIAPTDFQQGDAYRIIFIHVPAAWMGMFLYVLMAIYAGIGWSGVDTRTAWGRRVDLPTRVAALHPGVDLWRGCG